MVDCFGEKNIAKYLRVRILSARSKFTLSLVNN